MTLTFPTRPVAPGESNLSNTTQHRKGRLHTRTHPHTTEIPNCSHNSAAREGHVQSNFLNMAQDTDPLILFRVDGLSPAPFTCLHHIPSSEQASSRCCSTVWVGLPTSTANITPNHCSLTSPDD